MKWPFWTRTRHLELDDCDALESLLALYSDRMASPDELQRIESHLPGCETCRESLRWMQATRHALIVRPIALPPPDLQARIAGAIAAASASPLRPIRAFTLRPAYAAAASLTVVGAFLAGHALLTNHSGVSPQKPPTQAAALDKSSIVSPLIPTAPVRSTAVKTTLKDRVARSMPDEAAPIADSETGPFVKTDIPKAALPHVKSHPAVYKIPLVHAPSVTMMAKLPIKSKPLVNVLPKTSEEPGKNTAVTASRDVPQANVDVRIGAPIVGVQTPEPVKVASDDLLGSVREHIGLMRSAALTTTRQSFKQASYVAQVGLSDRVPTVDMVHGDLH